MEPNQRPEPFISVPERVEAVQWHEMPRPAFEAWCPCARVYLDDSGMPCVLLRAHKGEPGQIQLASESITDWIIKHADGTFRVASDKKFRANYLRPRS